MKKYLSKLFVVLGLKKQKKTKKKFPGSQNYWEQRYLRNDTSGPGSYGRLAEFKAEILNQFVKDNSVSTIIEYGCGDGNQLTLAEYPSYIGFDVSEKALEICREKFKDDPTKTFYNTSYSDHNYTKVDLVLSLDVIFHLIEDAVFNDYMSRLFNSSHKYVIIYSSNYDKNLTAHVKCRKFTDWIEKNISQDWQLTNYIKNKYPFDAQDPNNTSISDFYIYEKLSNRI